MKEISRRPEIAYYSINDPLDKRSWSGTTFYLGQTLQKNIGNVHFLGPVKIPWLFDKTFRAFQKLSRFFFNSEWIPKYSFLKNIYAAKILGKKMKGRHYDFLIAPSAAPELAFLKTAVPIIYFGDATYKIYSETYEKEFKNLNKLSCFEGNYLEKKSLKKSSFIILTSRWAANSAMKDYNIPAGKIVVLPLGANMDNIPDKKIIFRKEENKELTLLFLAVDWERKGGAIAYDTLLQLHALGIKAQLIVCGCVPPVQYKNPYVEVIPFLNKNEPNDYKRFTGILSIAHFLILPTRADCSSLAACEANAYGIPAITTNAGGIPDVIKNDVNGYCLPLSANGIDYASLIKHIYFDKDRYHNLIKSSRYRFEKELNWDKWAEHFANLLQKRRLWKDPQHAKNKEANVISGHHQHTN